MNNPLKSELINPKSFKVEFPKGFSTIKKHEIAKLSKAFEVGMFTEKNTSAVNRLATLIQEAVLNRIEESVFYN